MTRDEIIRIARVANLGVALSHYGGEQRIWIEGMDWHDEVEQFFKAAYEAGAAAERESCARLCDQTRWSGYVPPEDGAAATYYDDAATNCAEAIRARGKA
jgi:hypothetical protein